MTLLGWTVVVLYGALGVLLLYWQLLRKGPFYRLARWLVGEEEA